MRNHAAIGLATLGWLAFVPLLLNAHALRLFPIESLPAGYYRPGQGEYAPFGQIYFHADSLLLTTYSPCGEGLCKQNHITLTPALGSLGGADTCAQATYEVVMVPRGPNQMTILTQVHYPDAKPHLFSQLFFRVDQ